MTGRERPEGAGLARLAGLLADGTRATFCVAPRQGLLSWSRGLALTERGTAWLDGLGITLPPARRRAPVRSCLDWTQRRPHLAGAAGAAVCRHAFEAGWVTRVGTGRAVAVTGAGQDELRRHLGLEPG